MEELEESFNFMRVSSLMCGFTTNYHQWYYEFVLKKDHGECSQQTLERIDLTILIQWLSAAIIIVDEGPQSL